MELKNVILKIRQDNNLSQNELADQLFVSRQAVSRWESGLTTPNKDTLKLISKKYNISGAT